MNDPALQKLAIRIKRLTNDQQKQEQLIEEMKHLKPEQMTLLEDLIFQHDAECVELLNQKIEEQEQVMQYMAQTIGAQGDQSFTPDPLEFQKFMQDIFSNKESLALFLTFASDKVLAGLSDIVEKIAPDEEKLRFRSFFEEMRAHKTSVETRMKDAGKKEMVQHLEKREKQLAELEEVLNNVKKNTTYIA